MADHRIQTATAEGQRGGRPWLKVSEEDHRVEPDLEAESNPQPQAARAAARIGSPRAPSLASLRGNYDLGRAAVRAVGPSATRTSTDEQCPRPHCPAGLTSPTRSDGDRGLGGIAMPWTSSSTSSVLSLPATLSPGRARRQATGIVLAFGARTYEVEHGAPRARRTRVRRSTRRVALSGASRVPSNAWKRAQRSACGTGRKRALRMARQATGSRSARARSSRSTSGS